MDTGCQERSSRKDGRPSKAHWAVGPSFGANVVKVDGVVRDVCTVVGSVTPEIFEATDDVRSAGGARLTIAFASVDGSRHAGGCLDCARSALDAIVRTTGSTKGSLQEALGPYRLGIPPLL
jgi:hypothetical protein